MQGKSVYGKAKLLDTPYGKIAKTFVDEGIVMGISTRGLGSLKQITNEEAEVQDDFHLVTADLVADPSVPDAFVNGIMEGKEWILQNGKVQAIEIEKYRQTIQNAKRRLSPKKVEEAFIKLFTDYMSKLCS